MTNDENFDVIIATEKKEDNTVVLTTSEMGKKWLENAMKNYDPENKIYSAYLNDLSCGSPVITKEFLDSLAVNPQSDLRKVMQINEIARIYVNKDWIIGKVAEVIDTNVNSEYRLSYKDFTADKEKLSKLNECKQIIADFNDEINLRRLIKNSVPTSFIEGNYITYCRVIDGHYNVSWYPLGVAEVSDYDVNGEPEILINMRELQSRLRKTIKKTKKNTALFFEKLEAEIKANYPPEVYQAYIQKEPYAKLNCKWSGAMRINNQNRKYGITPIFRALYPALMLEQFDDTDRVNAKAKAKKFIVQLLNEKLLGNDSEIRESYEEQAFAHDNLMKAFKQKTVLVTTPAYVKDIKYVEPTASNTDSDTVTNYVNRELSTLGISFLMNSDGTGASVASISLDQLMKTINCITEQLEFIIEKWYRNILVKAGYSAEFAPTIRILDSELLEMEVKQDLAKLLYCNFNCSMETALAVLGIDINDEKAKRDKENGEKLHETFFARSTAFTSSGDVGRPQENNVDTIGKQKYDENYNKNQRV